MIDISDAAARRAIDAPSHAPLIAITGPAASGKTDTLARRYVALLAADATIAIDATIVSAPTNAGALALHARIAALLPSARAAELAAHGRYAGVPLERLAFDLLAESAAFSGLGYDLEALDPIDAADIFERAIAPLFSAEWSEYLGPDIDPEIPGLRAPDRFAVAVLRLIRKLRDAQISPDEFLAMALRGATAFYANPPNLSAPALLYATKDEHRPALAVDANERERQRRRELDLAKIVAKLYRSYLGELVTHGCLTPTDAIAEATRILLEHPAFCRTVRARMRLATIDDVHDLPTGEFRLLQAIFGKTLPSVSVAGDPDAATHTFAGARPERVFGAAGATFELHASQRVPAQIAAVVQRVLQQAGAGAIPAGDAVRLHRARDRAAEITFVADAIAEAIAGGTSPGRIALVHRSARTLVAYEDALVERNVAVALQGDIALFARHETRDALALLWSAVDPFAHAALLRVLALPFVNLNDATLAMLCGEPSNAQALLFDLLPHEDGGGARRWDRRRDLRLGTNVVRGDRDIDLTSEARARLVDFRTRRDAWQTLVRTTDPASAARAIVLDGGLFGPRPGETAARGRRRAALVTSLLDIIARYTERLPQHDLARALAYCERIAMGESGPSVHDDTDDAVAVGAIDCIKGRRFARVFVVDVRAGSFPPYYVPDAFLFSPTYGMIAKDNVGDGHTARTAKFTWYQHHAKLREAYGREDRRALAAALARADSEVTISASGKATRGIAAPELLAELEMFEPPLLRAPPPAARLRLSDPAAFATHESERPDAFPTPDVISFERAAARTRCSVCGDRKAALVSNDVNASLSAARTLGEERLVALSIGAVQIAGTLTIVPGDGMPHAAVRGKDASVLAALAIRALGARVSSSAYYVLGEDGDIEGPHPVDPQHAERTFAVLRGESSPVCNLCAESGAGQ